MRAMTREHWQHYRRIRAGEPIGVYGDRWRHASAWRVTLEYLFLAAYGVGIAAGLYHLLTAGLAAWGF